jgi:hypothetical protein
MWGGGLSVRIQRTIYLSRYTSHLALKSQTRSLAACKSHLLAHEMVIGGVRRGARDRFRSATDLRWYLENLETQMLSRVQEREIDQ